MLRVLLLTISLCAIPSAVSHAEAADATEDIARLMLLSPQGADAMAASQRLWDMAEGSRPDYRVLRGAEVARFHQELMAEDSPGWLLLSSPQITFESGLTKCLCKDGDATSLTSDTAGMPPVVTRMCMALASECEDRGGRAAVIADLTPPDYGVIAGFYASPAEALSVKLQVNTRIDTPGRRGKGGVSTVQHSRQAQYAEVSGIPRHEPVLLLQRRGSSFLVTVVEYSPQA